MRRAHEVEKVRAAEQALMARLPGGALMRRAAAGLAATCAALLPRVYGARVVLLVGSGDNGGDALYAGAALARRGARVDALLVGSRTHTAGLAALRGAGGTVAASAEVFDVADLVVDGLLGIGGRGGLREPAATLAARASASDATVVAVDLPSGVDASTGEVPGPAVRADVTVTFGTWKPCLLVDPAAEHAGTVELVDIGLDGDLPEPDLEALQAADVAAVLPRPPRDADKYRRGVVGVVAGSDRFPGAAVLTVTAAASAGPGMVRFSGPRRVADAVLAVAPDTVVHEGMPDDAGRVQAWVVGPGLDTDDVAAQRLEQVLAGDVPVLVDADGLTLLGRMFDGVPVDRQAPTVLTPHAGELARLAGVERAEVEASPLASVRGLAERMAVTCLLKGPATLVAERGAPVRANSTGTPWLATAGSGDVLSGLCGALLAQGLVARDAASVGAYLHGLAARHAAGGAPVPATGLVPALPAAWRAVAG